jgi:hypothetical protein
MVRYPDDPGFVSDSATSAAAADAAKEFTASQADRCEQWFKRWTEMGHMRTCEECEIAAKAAGLLGKHQSISARIRTDLFLKRGCLFKIATDRTTNASVRVWNTTSTVNLLTNERGQIVFRTRATTSGRQAVLYGWGYQ